MYISHHSSSLKGLPESEVTQVNLGIFLTGLMALCLKQATLIGYSEFKLDHTELWFS